MTLLCQCSMRPCSQRATAEDMLCNVCREGGVLGHVHFKQDEQERWAPLLGSVGNLG